MPYDVWRPALGNSRWQGLGRHDKPVNFECFGKVEIPVVNKPSFIFENSQSRECYRDAASQAASIGRQVAIESLKHTHGAVNPALRNELASWRFDSGLLDQLVWEYAAYRRALLLDISFVY